MLYSDGDPAQDTFSPQRVYLMEDLLTDQKGNIEQAVARTTAHHQSTRQAVSHPDHTFPSIRAASSIIVLVDIAIHEK